MHSLGANSLAEETCSCISLQLRDDTQPAQSTLQIVAATTPSTSGSPLSHRSPMANRTGHMGSQHADECRSGEVQLRHRSKRLAARRGASITVAKENFPSNSPPPPTVPNQGKALVTSLEAQTPKTTPRVQPEEGKSLIAATRFSTRQSKLRSGTGSSVTTTCASTRAAVCSNKHKSEPPSPPMKEPVSP